MQSTHIDPITKKPCRACSSGTQFKSFMSNNSKNTPKATSTNLDTFAISTTKQVHNQSEYTPFQCPANTEELGKSTWTFLHTMSAYYPESPNTQTKSDMSHFMSHFSTFYPCTHCASHLQDYIGKSPPDVDDNVALSKWMCDMHNSVNKRLGKPVFDCSRVFERWFSGTPGSECE